MLKQILLLTTGTFVLVLLVFVPGADFAILLSKFNPESLLLQVKAKVKTKVKTRRTVDDVIKAYGPAARKQWKRAFALQEVSYPPNELVLIGLKDEEKLLIFAGDSDSAVKKITEYPILGTSGTTGPKLKQGDFQMPEGFYRIASFNPNSSYHLSLRINYPNEDDRKRAREDKRGNLGGDIMIHGNNCSIGCLAMGDPAIEEIFTLVFDTGRDKTRVIMAPCDLTTKRPVIDMKKQPKWLPTLYKSLKVDLGRYLSKEN